MSDASEVSVNFRNFFITFAVSALLTVIAQTSFQKFVWAFVFVFVFASVGSNIKKTYQVFFDLDKTGFTNLSSDRNILVFSFDGISGPMVEEIFANDSSLKSIFNDFNFYNNVVATSPATLASLMGELYGNIDFKSIGSTEKDLLSRLDKSKLLMNQPEFNAYTYGEYNHFNANPSTRVPYGGLNDFTKDTDKIENIVLFYSYVAVRVGTVALVHGYDRMRPVLKSGVALISNSDSDTIGNSDQLSNELKHHKGYEWDKRNIASLSDFESILRNLKVSSRKPVVRFMHFTFTHFPVDFDINGTYRSHEDGWFGKNQNEDGVLAETTWAMKEISKVVIRLKEIRGYDNTLLVLKSDHGKPANYFNSTPNNLEINNHRNWGYNRYRPMLLIKDAGQRRGQPLEIDELVVLDDLASTLLKKARVGVDLKEYPGIDLLGLDFNEMPSFNLYVAEDSESDWRIDTHKKVKVSRDIDFLSSLSRHQEITLGSN